LIEELPAEVVMADTAYDTDQLRQAIAAAQRENAAPAQKGQKHCEGNGAMTGKQASFVDYPAPGIAEFTSLAECTMPITGLPSIQD
jgi:hypothetical protein